VTYAVEGQTAPARNTHKFISKTTENIAELVDILTKVDAFCRYCKPATPPHCVEQCEIWRTKHEFLEMSRIFNRDETNTQLTKFHVYQHIHHYVDYLLLKIKCNILFFSVRVLTIKSGLSS
jgi:ribosomal protein L44E